VKFDGSRSFGVRKSWVGRSELELSLAMRESWCERWAILQSALARRAGVWRASTPSIHFRQHHHQHPEHHDLSNSFQILDSYERYERAMIYGATSKDSIVATPSAHAIITHISQCTKDSSSQRHFSFHLSSKEAPNRSEGYKAPSNALGSTRPSVALPAMPTHVRTSHTEDRLPCKQACKTSNP